MRKIAAIMGCLFMAAAASADVYEGKIVKFSANVSSDTLTSEYCDNKPGESYYCEAITMSDVTIQKSDGSEVRVSKLLLPGKSHDGLMNMLPSDNVIFLGLALVPKVLWEGFDEFVDAAELSPLQFVLVDENQITPNASASLVALGKTRLTVTLTKSTAEAALDSMKEKRGTPEFDLLQSERKMTSELGGYLDLSKISGR